MSLGHPEPVVRVASPQEKGAWHLSATQQTCCTTSSGGRTAVGDPQDTLGSKSCNKSLGLDEGDSRTSQWRVAVNAPQHANNQSLALPLA